MDVCVCVWMIPSRWMMYKVGEGMDGILLPFELLALVRRARGSYLFAIAPRLEHWKRRKFSAVG